MNCIKKMITRISFAQIDTEVKDAILSTLSKLKRTSPENYILFLADGEFKPEYQSSSLNLNPYTIDNRIDRLKDQTRLGFFAKFLKSYYSFPASQLENDDDEFRMHIELMIYTHIWESKPFLKKLYRFARIAQGENYDWQVDVPDMGKHDFVRSQIRDKFKALSSIMANVITQGFHTSLRNAFAHSEYSFDTMNGNRRIVLYNYKGANWELREISFDDWSKRFVYSAFLSFRFLELTHKARVKIIEDFGTDTFTVNHPNSKGFTNRQKIKYIETSDSFNFI